MRSFSTRDEQNRVVHKRTSLRYFAANPFENRDRNHGKKALIVVGDEWPLHAVAAIQLELDVKRSDASITLPGNGRSVSGTAVAAGRAVKKPDGLD